MDTNDTADKILSIFERGCKEITNRINTLLQLLKKIGDNHEQNEKLKEEYTPLLKEISSFSNSILKSSKYTELSEIIDPTFSLSKALIEFLVSVDKNLQESSSEESLKQLNENRGIVEKHINVVLEEANKMPKFLHIEEVSHRLIFTLLKLNISIEKQDNNLFKKREKKSVIFLSQIIKHSKMNQYEAVTNDIFKASQDLVKSGRLAVADKDSFPEFTNVFKNLIVLTEKFLEHVKNDKKKQETSEKNLKKRLQSKPSTNNLNDESNREKKEQISNTLTEWFGQEAQTALIQKKGDNKLRKKSSSFFTFGKKKGKITKTELLLKEQQEKQAQELEERRQNKEKERAIRLNLAKKAREKKEEESRIKKESIEKEYGVLERRLSFIHEGRVKEAYQMSSSPILDPKKQKAMIAREKRLTQQMNEKDSKELREKLESMKNKRNTRTLKQQEVNEIKEKLDQSENERLEQEKREKEKERLQQERRERHEKENQEKLEQERLQREKLEKEKLEKENQERERQEQERRERERIEQEKSEKLERERQEQERQERLRKEKERLEREREERERIEKQRAEKERQEFERIEREKSERERLEKEKLEKLERERQERERLEKERLEKLERERLEKERLEKEKFERLEKERIERERLEKLRLEQERVEKLEREKLERERLEKERLEQERLEKEYQRLEKEEKERREKERLERLQKERLERERLERERIEKERLERERREKLERERLEKERQERERLEKERQERLERERQEKERIERERQERMERERLERERIEKERVERERLERLERERIEKERLERERVEKERVEREKLERLERERLEKERQEKERIERERRERERIEKERLEKERLEKERLEKERLLKERLEKERLELQRVEKERVERERLEKERLEKERLEKERIEKERLEKERLEKQRIEKERIEKEKSEKQRLENERIEREKKDKEKLDKERIEKEKKLEKERQEKEKKEKERLEKERIEKEKKLEKEKKKLLEKEKKRLEKEQKKTPEIGHKLVEIPNEEILEEIPDEEPLALVNLIKVCVDCGEEGEDAFCASCGGGMVEVEEDKLKAKQKVCLDCGQEGEDAFCASCGGEMINLNQRESHIHQVEDDEIREDVEFVLVCIDCGEEGTGENCIRCGGELVEIEEQEVDMDILQETIEHKDKEVDELLKKYGVKGKQNGNGSKLDQLLEDEYGLVELVEEEAPPPPREVDAGDVFIVDLGTDTVKYGWRSEKEPYICKNEIISTGMSSVNINTRPINASNFDFLKTNQHFVDLMRKVLKSGGYKVSNPLFITLSVPTYKEAPNDISDKFFESEYTNEPPAKYFIGYSPQLSAYSSLNTLQPTCILIDSGASMTSVIPLYYGSVIQHACQISSFGGDDIIDFISTIHLTSSKKNIRVPKNILSAISKECYVSLDFEREMLENGFQPSTTGNSVIRGYDKKVPEKEKKIDHEGLKLGVERFAVAEAFFKPSFVVKTNTYKPLDEMVLDCIRATPAHLHAEFLKAIVLVGENTKFKNLDKRLASRIKTSVPNFTVNVGRGPRFSAWKGAQALSNSPQFLDMCTDPVEYSQILMNHKFF